MACIVTVCFTPAPARANTITATIAFTGSPSDYGVTISGPVFDPTFGTLTGVSMTAAGSYTPDIFVGAQVPTASILDVALVTFGHGGGLANLSDGAYTLTQTGAYLTGPAELFTEATTINDAAALRDTYTAYGPYRSGGLLGLDVSSLPTTKGGWGLADDVSRFTGSLTVTYHFDVPEPSTLALLAAAAALLPLVNTRRRSVRTQA